MMRQAYGRGYGRSRGWRPAAILLALGLLFLIVQVFSLTGALTLLVLGGIFTAVSVASDRRGLVVPGGILLGLAVGTAAAQILEWLTGAFGAAATVGGLGLGFWLVYAIDRARHPARPAFGWARVPGTALLGLAALFGALSLLGLGLQLAGLALSWWPLLLIAGGIWLVVRGSRGRRQRRRRDSAPAGDPGGTLWPDLGT